MKKNLTEIVLIVDKSGSMNTIKNDTIGGVNSFLKSQKEEDGETTITLVLFDSDTNVVYQSIDIQSAAELTNKTYIPNGSTALYDSLGISLKLIKKRIDELSEEEKPEKVIVAVVTDGVENSSRLVNKEGLRKYTKDKIFEKITKLQTDSNYIFLYLGANQDAMQVGTEMGFMSNNTVSYSADSRGITATMDSVNNYTKSFRMSKLSSQEFMTSADLGIMYEDSLSNLDKKDEIKKDI